MEEVQGEQDRQHHLDNEKRKPRRNLKAKRGWFNSLSATTRAGVFAIIAAIIGATLGSTITGILSKGPSSQQAPLRLIIAYATAPQSIPTITATTAGSLEAIPYSPYRGKLALNDPLRDNSEGYNWQELSDSYSSCAFTGGAYHAKIIAGYFNACTTSTNTDYSDPDCQDTKIAVAKV